MSATESLIQRMLSFTDCFDGYPSMSCNDENLIFAAVAESVARNDVPQAASDPTDAVILMSYLASENVKTRDEYRNAKDFIHAYVECCWLANMCEGSNPVFEELCEEECDNCEE